MRSLLTAALAVLCLCVAGTPAPADEAAAWRYVVPALGEAFDHPPLRALALTDERPGDLKEEVAYRGKKQRYTQLRYGSPNSVRVAIVVDEVAPGEIDLYADVHRKRVIGPEDKVSGDRMTWQLRLDVAIVDGDKLKLAPRTLLFRYGRASRTLSYATCGFVEGRARLGDRLVAVRRVDGDGNGFFSDPQDRLWLDLDGSGTWDPLRHQFPFAPLLTVGKERFVVRSDPLGKRLSFDRLLGTGTVRLAIPTLPGGGTVEDVSVSLLSRDGIAATLQGKDAAAVLPIGEYRLTMLHLTLKEPKSGESWGYLFSDNGGVGEEWRTLTKDGTLVLDPVGRVKLTCPAAERGKCTAGETIQFRPGLYTGDGLLITTVCLGREISTVFSNGPRAKILLLGADGNTHDETSSGFA
jgi:hypothetical protein